MMKSLQSCCIVFLLSLTFCSGADINAVNYEETAESLKSEGFLLCPFQYGRFPDVNDCSKFYLCRFFIPTLLKCPESTLYDDKREECRAAKQVKCGNRPGGIGADDDEDKTEIKEKVFTCPYIWGTFADPVDCTKYIVCVYNLPAFFICPNGQLFQRYYRKCIPSNQVSCDSRNNPYHVTASTKKLTTTTEIPTTKAMPSTIIEKPNTPFNCKDSECNIKTTTSTTTTTATSTTTSEIIVPENPNTPPPTNCKESDIQCIIDGTKDVRRWFKCPERYGHYPFYGNQRLFIHCDNWQPFIKICAEDTVFSPVYGVCMWIGANNHK